MAPPSTSPYPEPSLVISDVYEVPTLTPLGAWTAITLAISIPIGLNNISNTSPFNTEF